MMQKARLLALGALLAGLPASAHHGQDFLVVESYEIPHPREGYGLASGAYGRDRDEEELELEPGVLFGLLPRMAGEIHAHFVQENGGSLEYEAVAPSLRVQLTDPHSSLPIQVGVSAEYEIGATRVADAFEARLILERSVDKIKVTANGIAHHSDSEAEYGYAAGVRYDIGEHLGLGFEAQGSSDIHQGLAGLYFEVTEQFTFKLGGGTRLGDEGPDATAHAGLVYRF
jgi:hypothetical protein